MRSTVYQFFSSKFPSLEMKTTDAHPAKRFKGEQGIPMPEKAQLAKVIKVFWRKKAARNGQHNKADRSTTAGTSSSSRNCHILHLEFTLMKRDMEHLHTLQELAKTLGVPMGDLSVAGVKDKHAVTYQRCVLTLRDDPMATKTSTSDASLLAVDTLREKAKGVLATLLSLSPHAARARSLLEKKSPYFTVSDISVANKPIQIGQLFGNRFRIRIRRLTTRAVPSIIDDSIGGGSASGGADVDVVSSLRESAQLVSNYGFPNFFGSQRMGSATSEAETEAIDAIDVNEYDVGDSLSSADEVATERASNAINTIAAAETKGSIADELSPSILRAGGSIDSPSVPLGPQVGKLLLQKRYRAAIECVILGGLPREKFLVPPPPPTFGGGGGDAKQLCGVNHTMYRARHLFVAGANPSEILSQLPRYVE
jgi:hypothetical protein